MRKQPILREQTIDDRRADALRFLSHVIDDAGASYATDDPALQSAIADRAVLVGWQCGFEPLFVAVIGSTMSTRGDRDIVDPHDAMELAKDYLHERDWFVDADDVDENGNAPDYVINPSR